MHDKIHAVNDVRIRRLYSLHNVCIDNMYSWYAALIYAWQCMKGIGCVA